MVISKRKICSLMRNYLSTDRIWRSQKMDIMRSSHSFVREFYVSFLSSRQKVRNRRQPFHSGSSLSRFLTWPMFVSTVLQSLPSSTLLGKVFVESYLSLLFLSLSLSLPLLWAPSARRAIFSFVLSNFYRQIHNIHWRDHQQPWWDSSLLLSSFALSSCNTIQRLMPMITLLTLSNLVKMRYSLKSTPNGRLNSSLNPIISMAINTEYFRVLQQKIRPSQHPFMLFDQAISNASARWVTVYRLLSVLMPLHPSVYSSKIEVRPFLSESSPAFLQHHCVLGVSWSVGGDNTYSKILSVPNALRQYNPDLEGYSTKASVIFLKGQNATNNGLNVGKRRETRSILWWTYRLFPLSNFS